MAAALLAPSICHAKTLAEVFEKVRVKAENGDPVAQYNLGLMIFYGEGTTRDQEKGWKWLRWSAEQGNPDATYFLAWLSDDPKDAKWKKIAFEQNKKAAEHGDASAQYRLSEIYYRGIGVPEDDKESTQWLFKAANQGLVEAQDAVGVYYDDGDHGFKRDSVEAMKWFRKVADKGGSGGEFSLAYSYREGKEVPEDQAKSVEYFRRAAMHGDIYALKNAGLAYYQGKGVPQDFVEALAWFQAGITRGGDGEVPGFSARECVEQIEPKLTPAEKEKAKRRCKEILDAVEANSAAEYEKAISAPAK